MDCTSHPVAAVVTTTEGVFRVRVVPAAGDEDDNPRLDGPIGVMVLAHRRYRLPREGELADRIEEVRSDARYGATPLDRFATLAGWLKVEHDVRVVLPVWGYDHGELHLKAGERTYPFDDRWDSGLAGIIYDNPDQADELAHLDDAQIADELTHEVGQYDQWANNELFGFAIDLRVDDDWSEQITDSGIYYTPEEALEQGKLAVPGDVRPDTGPDSAPES